MFNIFLLAVLFILLLIFISIRLKKRGHRLLLWLAVFAALPALAICWYQWGKKESAAKLVTAAEECRQKKKTDMLHLIFSGFTKRDITDSALTIHRNATGTVLDSGKQHLDTIMRNGNAVMATYYYLQPFAVDDVLEIRLGTRNYTISNFVLTAAANYNAMGRPAVSGCMIDSADINGKRTPFVQNMIIRSTDDFSRR